MIVMTKVQIGFSQGCVVGITKPHASGSSSAQRILKQRMMRVWGWGDGCPHVVYHKHFIRNGKGEGTVSVLTYKPSWCEQSYVGGGGIPAPLLPEHSSFLLGGKFSLSYQKQMQHSEAQSQPSRSL